MLQRISFIVILCSYFLGISANEPPSFYVDLNNLVISEDTAVGTVIGTLNGSDPEGSPVRYGISGTDFLSVDPNTGDVKLIKPLDREVSDSLQFTVQIEDEIQDEFGGDNNENNNIVKVPVSIILEDVNDNAPKFLQTPYKITVPEDALVHSTVFESIRIEDDDLIGEILDVSCEPLPLYPEACETFAIQPLNNSERYYEGAIILLKTVKYNDKDVYEFSLKATDGKFETRTKCEIRVLDVQNSPPVFQSSLTAIVQEDAPIGTHVLTIQAKDGDRGAPRTVVYDLRTNPFDYFLLDNNKGELRTAKPLDRESLSSTNGVLSLTVRARELIDGVPSSDEDASSTAVVSVTIRDVNDEPPMFNRKEYYVSISENMPAGSPLPNLDMTVGDTDIGNNSAFSLRLEDVSGAFTIEPTSAVGSTSVIIRLGNTSLDYENPNQRKFIILVIAEESKSLSHLSSTSTVTVEVLDVNDNSPEFENPTYTATISELALPGTVVTTITANDRDSGIYGKESIVYDLIGDGVEKFNVNKKTGDITVALCPSPGNASCLDFETKNTYFLTYKATDNEGQGFNTSVPFKVTIVDSNDNAPVFKQKKYTAVIDEGAMKFEPPFFVEAEDSDKTSTIRYSIADEHVKDLFGIDPVTGEIIVLGDSGIMRSLDSGSITFVVRANDHAHTSEAVVSIEILDVNNNQPEFLFRNYNVNVSESAEKGKKVMKVSALDNDTGINAKLTYRIEKGAFEDFSIDNETGLIRVASKLDFDRRNIYNITITATDGGTPMLTGSAMVQVNIMNTNDKNPYFDPPVQKTEVPKDAKIGTVFYTMKATDPDINDTDALTFEFAYPITAVDKHGKEIVDNEDFKSFFVIDPSSGNVSVNDVLQRDVAAVVQLTVLVTDTSAEYEQQGNGTLMVTILDVNDIPPVFAQPWTKKHPYYITQIQEELPENSVLGTFTATDSDSDIDHYTIEPESEYFVINETTGTIYTAKRIDYEDVQNINFTIRAYDSGRPQLSTAAYVIVEVLNINDMSPTFEQSEYFATVKENSPKNTLVIKVSASDGDLDEFGKIRYTFKGDYVNDFVINEETGEIRVASSALLDREKVSDILLKVEASDLAPKEESKSVVVPVHVKIEDDNDNGPVFMQHHYSANIVETIPYSPASPIVQLHAEDKDEKNRLRYHIVNGDDEEAFQLDYSSGILYPRRSLLGLTKQFKLTVEVTDGKFVDKAVVEINVLDVNQNKPLFKEPSSSTNASILIPENVEVNYLVTKVYAEDKDPGENGRVTYHFKVRNNLTQTTDEFMINEHNGELRTISNLDREKKASYQLILVARDHGTQTTYETLQLLTIILKDIDDNKPTFMINDGSTSEYTFTISENNPVNYLIGKVSAEDPDEGDNAKIYYYIIKGNEDGMFRLDRRDGSVYVLGVLDKEKNESHQFYVKATNSPNYNSAANEIIAKGDPTIAHVQIVVRDENDNAPYFTRKVYYAGIDAKAPQNEPITEVRAEDPDEDIYGQIHYEITASHLYKTGANQSSGSVIPSPFQINAEGKVSTAVLMSEYNQDRFQLHIVARESAFPHRESTATLNIWVYDSQQLARVILSRPPDEVKNEAHKIASELSNATGNVIVVDAVRYHVNGIGQVQHDWCDMYMHMINADTQTIVTIPDVLKIIDAKYDYLKAYYAGFAIENVLPAYVEKTDEPFEPALAALVALTIVLFVGCASVLVLCCCFRHWVIMEPLDMKCDMLIKKPIIDDLSTTENPLWIEQKLKLYEEQELTMQVFCEPEANRLPVNSTFERRGSDETSVVDNTYATIQHPGRRNSVNTMLTMGPGDYATLGGSVLPLDKTSSHSQQMIEAALGFQGCTFQVPDGPADTTELLRARSELRMNKDGQPEFVSELM